MTKEKENLMTQKGLTEQEKAKIIALCRSIIPGVKILLYGSRARGTYNERSDIDIALDNAGKPIGFFLLEKLKSVLAASDIKNSIDIVDYNAINDKEFKQEIDKEGIWWTE